jgi:outer membrane protein
MDKKKLLTVGLVVISITSLFISGWIFISTPRIAFVNSSILVNKYLGIKEVMKVYEAKENEWKNNIDTLYSIYMRSNNYLESNRFKMSKKELDRIEREVNHSKENYLRYQSDVEKSSLEEKQKLMQGALNQINSFIEEYAKERRIDIVIGVTQSGNVLYGSERIDITDEVVEGLNKSYSK